MSKDMILEKIQAIVAEQMGIEQDTITLTTTFTEDLGADSLDLFQMISEMEEAFGMEFDSNATASIKTIGDAVDYVQNATK